MGAIGRILHFLIHSNLLIAFAAAGLAFQTQIEFGIEPQFKPYLLLIFFATFFDYNIHRLHTILYYPESLIEEKYKWLRQNIKLFYCISILSGIGFITTIFFARIEVLLMLLPFGLLTFLYAQPFLQSKVKIVKLRELPYLKIFLIAFVWSGVCTFVPYIESTVIIPLYKCILVFTMHFLFIFALTIPFDVRDMKSDSKQGLVTIAHVLNEKQAYQFASILIILQFLVSIIAYYNSDYIQILLAYGISSALTLLILNAKSLRNKSYYHLGLLDGSICIQSILVNLFNFF